MIKKADAIVRLTLKGEMKWAALGLQRYTEEQRMMIESYAQD